MDQLTVTKAAYCTTWVIAGILMLAWAGMSFGETSKNESEMAIDFYDSFGETSAIMMIMIGVFVALAGVSVFFMWKDDKCSCGLWGGTTQQKMIAVYALLIEATGIVFANAGGNYLRIMKDYTSGSPELELDIVKILCIVAGTCCILGSVVLNCSWNMGKNCSSSNCPTLAQTGTFVWVMMAGQGFVQILQMFEDYPGGKDLKDRYTYVGIWMIVGGLSACLHSVNAWVTFPPSDIVEQMSGEIPVI